MKVKIIYLVVTFITIIGCSKLVVTPLVGYSQLKLRSYAKSVEQIDFSKSEEIKLVVPNDFKLALTDSIFLSEDTLLSNYRLFKFTTTASKWHRINIISYPYDRKLFEGYSFIPEIKVLDKTKHLVSLQIDKTVATSPDEGMIRKGWVFEQVKPDIYYLVVYSDNRKIGQERLKSNPNEHWTAGGTNIKASFKYSLFGDFRVRIEKL